MFKGGVKCGISLSQTNDMNISNLNYLWNEKGVWEGYIIVSILHWYNLIRVVHWNLDLAPDNCTIPVYFVFGGLQTCPI